MSGNHVRRDETLKVKKKREGGERYYECSKCGSAMAWPEMKCPNCNRHVVGWVDETGDRGREKKDA